MDPIAYEILDRRNARPEGFYHTTHYQYKFKSNNKIRANIGFRFNITIIALQANYTFSEYPIATIGVGLSVR